MRRFLCLGIFLLIVLFAHQAFAAFGDGDFQYWNTEQISWKVQEKWQISAEEEFRFGSSAGRFYYQHTDITLKYSGMADWFDIAAGYRLVYENKGQGKWAYENRPQFEGIFKMDLWDLKLSDRNRFEWRFPENKTSRWRYRNKLTFALPLKISELNFKPYVADEIFVDFKEGELNRNRLYGGIEFKLLKHLTFDIYYLWESTKSGKHWVNYNVLGTKLKAPF